MKASELRKGQTVRPAGSARHTRWRTVDNVSPSSVQDMLLVTWRGEGGHTTLVSANKEYELPAESLPVLRCERKTVDTYHLTQSITVQVYRGSGKETVETNAIRVTCEHGERKVDVWLPGAPGRYVKLTDSEEDRLLRGLGVKQ